MKFYQGRFVPSNPKKYKGNVKDIIYRSSWEFAVMQWLDRNDKVVKWASEEFFIPYINAVDNKPHRYFVDFYILFTNGEIYLVEVKPKSQVEKPKARKRMSRKYLLEQQTWAKNLSKWDAAMKYCRERKWIFKIWTEHHLQELGINVFHGK